LPRVHSQEVIRGCGNEGRPRAPFAFAEIPNLPGKRQSKIASTHPQGDTDADRNLRLPAAVDRRPALDHCRPARRGHDPGNRSAYPLADGIHSRARARAGCHREALPGTGRRSRKPDLAVRTYRRGCAAQLALGAAFRRHGCGADQCAGLRTAWSADRGLHLDEGARAHSRRGGADGQHAHSGGGSHPASGGTGRTSERTLIGPRAGDKKIRRYLFSNRSVALYIARVLRGGLVCAETILKMLMTCRKTIWTTAASMKSMKWRLKMSLR